GRMGCWTIDVLVTDGASVLVEHLGCRFGPFLRDILRRAAERLGTRPAARVPAAVWPESRSVVRSLPATRPRVAVFVSRALLVGVARNIVAQPSSFAFHGFRRCADRASVRPRAFVAGDDSAG